MWHLTFVPNNTTVCIHTTPHHFWHSYQRVSIWEPVPNRSTSSIRTKEWNSYKKYRSYQIEAFVLNWRPYQRVPFAPISGIRIKNGVRTRVPFLPFVPEGISSSLRAKQYLFWHPYQAVSLRESFTPNTTSIFVWSLLSFIYLFIHLFFVSQDIQAMITRPSRWTMTDLIQKEERKGKKRRKKKSTTWHWLGCDMHIYLMRGVGFSRWRHTLSCSITIQRLSFAAVLMSK